MSLQTDEKQLFGMLWSYVRKDSKNLILTSFFLLLNTAIATIAPLFFQTALSILEEVERGRNLVVFKPLFSALIFYFLLTILSWFSSATITIFTTRLNAGIIQNLRQDSFESLLKNRISFFDDAESGDLVSVLTNDLNELYSTGNAVAEVFTSLLRLVGILSILFFFSPLLTFTSLGLLPIFFLVALVIRKYRRQTEQDWRKNFGKVNQSFAETMRSIEVSKAFNREKENIENFTSLNEATYQASLKRGAAIFISRPVADFLRNILLIALLAVGSWLVDSRGLSVATFYLFIFLIDFYYEPVRGIARNYHRFQSLFANLQRILGIAHKTDRYEDFSTGLELDDFSGDISFRGVDFSYDGIVKVLEDISFSVKPGRRIALVGHTGAGKTTIAALIMRFYEKLGGSITLDGEPIENYTLQSLRKHIALVSQTVLLFKGTIKENLRIANSRVTEKEMWEAIDAVQAREFIEMLPDGLDTMIEEDGKNLSAGQRQMISFARALLSNPRAIILDEATSAVDLYTEAKIQHATDLLLEGKTSVVIAHRLTTIIRSDLIVVLEKGRVVQKGSHNELVNKEGPYKELYELYFKTQSAEYLETIKVSGTQ